MLRFILIHVLIQPVRNISFAKMFIYGIEIE